MSEGASKTMSVTNLHQISRVTIFTGSASGSVPGFMRAAQTAAEVLVESGIEIVYGAGNSGMMGAVAQAALNAGGKVHGVMSRDRAVDADVHRGLTTLKITDDRHSAKLEMSRMGDAFIALPGGSGTLEEFFEVWTWQQLGIHAKPVGLLNVNGFWDGLLKAIDSMIIGGFLDPQFRESLIVEASMPELLARMERLSVARATFSKAS